MIDNDRFHNKNGTLTAYALACGYLESQKVDGADYYGSDADGVMLRAEGGVYHVFTRIEGVTVDGPFPVREGGVRMDWESYDTLTEARRAKRAAWRRVKAAQAARDAF